MNIKYNNILEMRILSIFISYYILYFNFNIIILEFSYAQVNWEEYQSQLITCNKCKRKFHPLRIKKHESCCKKL